MQTPQDPVEPHRPLDETTLETLERYATNPHTAHTDPAVAELIASRPDLVRNIDRVLTTLRAHPKPETERSLQLARRRLGVMESTRPPKFESVISSRRPQPLRRYLIGTAGAILTAAIAFGVFQRTQNPSATAPEPIHYSTPPGQHAHVTLSDGSLATLSPGSSLEMRGRSASLIGEALFTVTQSSAEPFVVNAGGASVRVLGTRFGVRRYDTDTTTRIAVADGKVAVGDAVLVKGDIASVIGSESPVVTHDIRKVNTMLAFAQGQLVLEDVTLREAVPQLARWFGVDIRVGTTIPNTRFSITLDGESPRQAFDDLTVLLGVSYTHDAKTITISR